MLCSLPWSMCCHACKSAEVNLKVATMFMCRYQHGEVTWARGVQDNSLIMLVALAEWPEVHVVLLMQSHACAGLHLH